MADVIITMKVMPESPEIDLDALQEKVKAVISEFEGRGTKVDIEPVAFGLKALIIRFAYDENKGSTDDMEAKVSEVEGVNSVDIIGVDRALG